MKPGIAIAVMLVVLLSPFLDGIHLFPAAVADGAYGWSADSSRYRLRVANATIDVRLAPGRLRLSRVELLDWISNCARAVREYYGRFPVDHLELLITPVDGYGLSDGAAYGYAGALIRLGVGRFNTRQSLDRNWVLVHEMVHLAFPSTASRHLWLQEGLATYIEPLARLNVNQSTPAEVWWWMVNGLPKGLPVSGDRGLDHTHTWGRTYWGGALFCLLADIEIRESTHNRRSLRDALRAINEAGGNITQYWPIARALKIGDKAIGVPVLTKLYNEMKAAPHAVDLDALWRRLGVSMRGRQISFDDTAELNDIRKGITSLSVCARDRG